MESNGSFRGSRRRRANVQGGRSHAHLVRVSEAEEAALYALASREGMSIPRLLVESALVLDRGETVSERRRLLTELFAVHRLLGSIANNVNQLTRFANSRQEITGDMRGELTGVLSGVRRILGRIDRTLDGLAL